MTRTDIPLTPVPFEERTTSPLWESLTPRTPMVTGPAVRGNPGRPRRFTATHKWCPDCEQMLAHDWFQRDASTASGLRVYCRHCSNERQRERRERKHRRAA